LIEIKPLNSELLKSRKRGPMYTADILAENSRGADEYLRFVEAHSQAPN